MKKIITLTIIFIITTVNIFAQEKNCNRTVHVTSFAKRLPQDICLPDGYFLRAILSDTIDIDSDGRVDFAGKLRKVDAQDGDTTLVILYRQKENGNYEEWEIFDNLFPIYLRDYYFDYYRDHKDTSYFMKLRQLYQSPEYSDVFFEKNTMVIKFNTGGAGGFLLYFSLDRSTNTWKLTKQIEWYGLRGKIEEIERSITPENQYDIKEFNILDYLDEIIFE